MDNMGSIVHHPEERTKRILIRYIENQIRLPIHDLVGWEEYPAVGHHCSTCSCKYTITGFTYILNEGDPPCQFRKQKSFKDILKDLHWEADQVGYLEFWKEWMRQSGLEKFL